MVSFTQFALLAFAVIPSFSVAAPLRHGSGLDLRNVHHRRACKTASASSASATHTTSVKNNVDVVSTTSTKKAATTTSSSSAHASSTTAAVANAVGGGNAFSMLQIFPVSIQNAISSWSTSSIVAKPLPLNDATLNIVQGKNTQHKYIKAPDGTDSVQAFYAKGSISPGHTSSIGGFALYSKGPTDLTVGKEVTFSYSAFFEEGFQFNKGGKMPGLYGGINENVARTCSGGDYGNGECFSLRLMWRTNGAGELYAYLPQIASNKNQFENTQPKTITNDAYGISTGRGAYKWATGEWTHIAQRVLLNDVGKSNGEVEVYVNGVSVIKTTGLIFRTDAASKVRGAQIQTFFGGHTEEWASPKDQSCYFKDFSVAVVA